MHVFVACSIRYLVPSACTLVLTQGKLDVSFFLLMARFSCKWGMHLLQVRYTPVGNLVVQ